MPPFIQLLKAASLAVGFTVAGGVIGVICIALGALVVEYILHWEIENGILPFMFLLGTTSAGFILGGVMAIRLLKRSPGC